MTSVLKVDNIQNSSGTQSMEIASNGFVIPPAGGIIQIQYNQLTTGTMSQSIAANTYVKLNNFPTVTITPVSTSSKIMIDVMWNGEFGVVNNTWGSVFTLYRDDTLIKGNTDSGYNYSGIAVPTTSYTSSDDDSTMEQCIFKYYDEPNTTSAITYAVGVKLTNADTVRINRVVNASTADGYERAVSHITATEIAG